MTPTAYENRFTRHVAALRCFVQREGHCRVPYAHIEAYDGEQVALGRWTTYIRKRHQTGKLSEARVAMFAIIPGWAWESRKPGPPPQIARNREIKKLRESGLSLSAIAEAYGLSKQRIYQLTAGVKPTNKEQAHE